MAMKSKIIFLATVGALLSSFLFVSPASAATARTRPGQPRNVTAVAGNSSATVRFLPPTSNGGNRINRYDIQINTPTTKRVSDCRSTDCHVGDLTAGTSYSFQVAAVTKIGRGAYSIPSKIVTPTGSVSIAFNANGGTGTMASESQQFGAIAALTPNAFTYVGYTFTGWNTRANGSGTAFVDGATLKFEANAILYAQWTVTSSITTATITFNANGGTGTMAPEIVNVNAATALTANSFTRSGYTFSGWNTTASGGGMSYSNGASYSFVASTTLYAQWTAGATVPFPGQVSSNWSGYVLPTTSIVTLVSGEWTVPTLNCAATPNGEAGTWVGTGGAHNAGTLLQTGVNELCDNGFQENYGFWEIWPAIPNHSESYSDFPVVAGDTMTATVGYVNNQWVTVLEDLNTGLSGVFIAGDDWEVVTTSSGTVVGGVQGIATGYSYSGGYSAEWIQEDVTNVSSGSLFTFPDYGSVTFTGLKTSPSAASLPNSDGVEIKNSAGDVLSVPGPYNGTDFTVSYSAY